MAGESPFAILVRVRTYARQGRVDAFKPGSTHLPDSLTRICPQMVRCKLVPSGLKPQTQGI